MLVIWLSFIEYHSIGSVDEAIRSCGWRGRRNALTRTTAWSLFFFHRRCHFIRLTCLRTVGLPSLGSSSCRLLLSLVPIVNDHCSSAAKSWCPALRRSLRSECASQVVRKRFLSSWLPRGRLCRCSLRWLLLHHLRCLCLDRWGWTSRWHIMIDNQARSRTNITYKKSNQKINISRKVDGLESLGRIIAGRVALETDGHLQRTDSTSWPTNWFHWRVHGSQLNLLRFRRYDIVDTFFVAQIEAEGTAI